MHPNLTKVPFIHRLLCSGLGAGYSPFVPGTVGSLVALPFYFIPGFESPAIMLTAIVVAFLYGAYGAHVIEKQIGHDPGVVVLDEVIGMWISLLFLPKSITIVIIAFVLFRIFDIIKPWPASIIQKKSGGWAIMADDVAAGVYANLVLQLGTYFFPL